MLPNLGRSLLLDKKREKAKARIEQVLLPIWNNQEIPKIQDLDGFGEAAEGLWRSTGSSLLGQLLDPVDIQPRLSSGNEISSLGEVTDFTFTKTVAAAWARSLSSLEKPVGRTDSELALYPIDGARSHFDADTVLGEYFDEWTIEKIDAYLDELTAGVASDRPDYSLTTATVTSWQQMEAFVRLYAVAYISRLVYVHCALDRLLSAEDASECRVSLTLSRIAENSNEATPQVLKRPPPRWASATTRPRGGKAWRKVNRGRTRARFSEST